MKASGTVARTDRLVRIVVAPALAYATLALLGRMTVPEGGTVALVWPAAGLGVIWFMATRGRLELAASAVALALALGSVTFLTGGTTWLAAVGAVAHVVQTLVVLALVRRWIPGILGTGGSVSIHTPRVLLFGSLAVVLGAATGAAIGMVALLYSPGGPDVSAFLAWWGRNVSGVLTVGTVLHLLWEGLVPPRDRSAWWDGRETELVALLASSAIVYGTVFFQNGLALAFLCFPLGLWCGTRFPTWLASVHSAVFGALALFLTIEGRGPFNTIGDPTVQALVTQTFLLVVLLNALTIATIRDERRRLIRELAQSRSEVASRVELLDAMTEAISDGLAVVNAEGDVVRVNSAARTLLGQTEVGGVANTRAYELRRPDGSRMTPAEHPSRRALTEGPVPPEDIELPFSDGSTRVLSVSAVPLTGGEAMGTAEGALIVYRDVTDEREQSNRLAGFAAVVAHDLRSPLTALRGWLDLAEGTDPAVARAKQSAIHMSSLIQDLLDQATAEGAELSLQPLELGGPDGVVCDLVELMGLHVEVDVDPTIPALADLDLVRQLLANLIGNAVKYVGSGVSPAVRVTGRAMGTRTLVEITDNGIGVPVEHQEKIFDRFHRAHAADRRFVGTGLGLAICRTIVERHGGTIVCETPSSGTGTTFRFDLPGVPGRPRPESAGACSPIESAPASDT